MDIDTSEFYGAYTILSSIVLSAIVSFVLAFIQESILTGGALCVLAVICYFAERIYLKNKDIVVVASSGCKTCIIAFLERALSLLLAVVLNANNIVLIQLSIIILVLLMGMVIFTPLRFWIDEHLINNKWLISKKKK